MAIKYRTTVTVNGSLVRDAEGTGPRGGKAVLSDTGRTMKGIATTLGNEIVTDPGTLEAMGKVFEDEVRKAAPEQTGALRNSIRHEVGASQKGRGQVAVLAGGPEFPVPDTKNTRGKGYVDYAVIVHEINTRYMDIGFNNAKKIMEQELAKGAIKTITKRK